MTPSVLFDATPLARGHGQRGIGQALRHLIEHMPLAGRPTLLIVRSQIPPAGFHTREFRWPRWPLSRIPDPWPSLHLHDHLRKDPPGLFYATQPELTPDPHLVPTVINCHDLIPLHRPLRNPLHRHAYSTYLQRLTRAKRIVSVSHATAADLTASLGIPASRIDVVHHGTPDIIAPHGAVPERPYVLYGNSLEAHKNAAMAIDAVARTPDVDLVMTGMWSRRRLEALKRRAATTSAADRIHWLGYVDAAHLAALRRGAVAVLVPSLLEGFGFPVLESLAVGTPALASDIPALREAGGEVATYLPTDDPAAWADAIAAARDPAERDRVAHEGPAHAAGFSWQRAAAETVASWQRAMADD